MSFSSLPRARSAFPSLLACLLLSACGGSGGGDGAGDAGIGIRSSQEIVAPRLVCDAADPALAKWSLATDSAGWSARDSHVMYAANGAIFLYGGWEDSYVSSPLDLWATTDGKDWTRIISAASPYSDFASVAQAFGRHWMVTGWKDGRLDTKGPSKEIWSSVDGVNWSFAGNAPFSARVGTPLVAFNGKLWIFGGTENYFSETTAAFKNDVWSSTDGVTWERVAEHAPWSPRAFANAAVLGDKLFLVGGGRYGNGITSEEFTAESDVWSTKDGVQWVNESANAGWTPRIWSTLVAYRGALWFMGGFSNYPALNHNDVWWSSDGKQWRRLDDAPWTPRHAQATLVFNNQIFLTGGNSGGPLSNEVWTLGINAPDKSACGPGY